MRGRIKEQEQQKRRTTNINIEITMFHLNAAVLCVVVGKRGLMKYNYTLGKKNSGNSQ